MLTTISPGMQEFVSCVEAISQIHSHTKSQIQKYLTIIKRELLSLDLNGLDIDPEKVNEAVYT